MPLYRSRGFIRYYYYRDNPKMVQDIFVSRIIPNCCKAYDIQLNLTRYPKKITTKSCEICDSDKLQVHNIFGYSQQLCYCTLYIYDVSDDIEHRNINQKVLKWSMSNIPLVVFEGTFGTIDAEDSYCHGY